MSPHPPHGHRGKTLLAYCLWISHISFGPQITHWNQCSWQLVLIENYGIKSNSSSRPFLIVKLPFPVEWTANCLPWDFFPSSKEISLSPPKLSSIKERCPQIRIALFHFPHGFWDIHCCSSGLHILFFCFHLDMPITERYGLFKKYGPSADCKESC